MIMLIFSFFFILGDEDYLPVETLRAAAPKWFER